MNIVNEPEICVGSAILIVRSNADQMQTSRPKKRMPLSLCLANFNLIKFGNNQVKATIDIAMAIFSIRYSNEFGVSIAYVPANI
ncbi:hypothetical protein OIY81_3525 [Cryptosporidium canis]|nr:hypothetical protein OIY81_3525 [Cryptosporidium canis]